MSLEKPSCPAEITLTVIAGRWKLMVIFWLLKGTRRFNELQRRTELCHWIQPLFKNGYGHSREFP